jgi:RNA-binding motif X-linked protein 2
VTIFSQFGEPVHVNLVRDKETGKSKGFAFLKYEDQRSTDLAVDNLGGAVVLGRVLKVDHTRYKRKDDEPDEDNMARQSVGRQRSESESDGERRRRKRRDTGSVSAEEATRPLLREERELAALIRDHDEEDPMKEYLVKEKQEVDAALRKYEKRISKSKGGDRKHKHRHRHRSRRDSSGGPPPRAKKASHDHGN